ncbi:MAG: metallophosphoesterase [Candidatus Gastranaerophilales bacterium]|nr:metallophosphoesterase [Candidatus Gastranaerophilales bacterium]
MKKALSVLILGLCLTCFFVASAEAKNIKFAQITDVHYKVHSDILCKMIKDINKTSDIDFVIFTGDNIGQTNQKNLQKFLDDTKKLNKPYYFVLGNKDVSKSHDLTKDTYMKMVHKTNKLHPKTSNYVFKKNNVVFLVADGSKEVIPSVSGFYNKETLQWIDEQLTKYKFNKVVIFQHFPLANKPSNEFYLTHNAIEYLQMLSKHNNVIAVVTGHYHKNDEVMYNGVYHITSPAASEGSYKIIEIDMDNDYEVFTILKDVK